MGIVSMYFAHTIDEFTWPKCESTMCVCWFNWRMGVCVGVSGMGRERNVFSSLSLGGKLETTFALDWGILILGMILWYLTESIKSISEDYFRHKSKSQESNFFRLETNPRAFWTNFDENDGFPQSNYERPKREWKITRNDQIVRCSSFSLAEHPETVVVVVVVVERRFDKQRVLSLVYFYGNRQYEHGKHKKSNLPVVGKELK